MPEVPPLSGSLTDRVDAVFAPGGVLARSVAGFERRAGQIDMAAAVARQFETGGVLLAEAGTGTGKTLAYLIPAILSGQRVLVSTGTKNLQEQIYFKDIPALRETLGIPFTATCMKGRANYLCLHRLDLLPEAATAARLGGASTVFLPMIREWAARTKTGDRAELDDLPEEAPLWNDVSATAETCLGTECPRYDDCFVTLMRQRAAASDVVIVNHHLLCADAAVRQHAYGEVIPACANAVVDEAHQLEDVATQYFGYVVSNYRVEELARDVERAAGASAVATHRAASDIERAVADLRDGARAFFADLTAGHRSGDRTRGEERVRTSRATLERASASGALLAGALDFVETALTPLLGAASSADDAAVRRPAMVPTTDTPTGPTGVRSIRLSRAAETSTTRRRRAGGGGRLDVDDGQGDSLDESVAALVRRAGELRDELRLLLRASEAEYVYFVEFRGRGVFLRAAPVDVSRIVRELLLDRMRTTVLTSATLTVDGTFDYIRQRLGIRKAEEVCLP
ncbi:MAG: ATP-dependent DNA helicase, partial [Acidobacteriota bacterium]